MRLLFRVGESRRRTAVLALWALVVPAFFIVPAFAGDDKKNEDPDQIGNRDPAKASTFIRLKKRSPSASRWPRKWNARPKS